MKKDLVCSITGTDQGLKFFREVFDLKKANSTQHTQIILHIDIQFVNMPQESFEKISCI